MLYSEKVLWGALEWGIWLLCNGFHIVTSPLTLVLFLLCVYSQTGEIQSPVRRTLFDHSSWQEQCWMAVQAYLRNAGLAAWKWENVLGLFSSPASFMLSLISRILPSLLQGKGGSGSWLERRWWALKAKLEVQKMEAYLLCNKGNVLFPFDTLNNDIKKNIFPPREEISFRRIAKFGAFPKLMPFFKDASCIMQHIVYIPLLLFCLH